MANSYSPVDMRKVRPSISVSGAASTVISNSIQLSAQGSLHLRIDVQVSGVTVGSGITAKLQMRSIDEDWADLVGANASVAITTAGTVSMRQNVEVAADQPNMPLKKQIQVVLTTTSGSVITVEQVRVSQGM